MKRALFFLLAGGLFLLNGTGCGYTTKSLLAENIQTVHVKPVTNAIDLSEEVTTTKPFRTYRPGLEVEITNAVINRVIFDGNLKIAPPDQADAVFDIKLSDYHRDALRYSESDDIQEYRLSVTAQVTLTQASDQKVVWQESLTGDTTFFLSGPRAVSEDEAAAKAVEDLARRIVDRTIEAW